jgi:shikimate kinase
MLLERHVILIGPMGAGKSTIGRLLSEQFNFDFVDLDKEIEDRSGATIPWIFDIEGEQGFRERESGALEEIISCPPLILATGGGCVLSKENRATFYRSGISVYLATSVEQQLVRTAKDKNRPLLQTGNPEEVLKKMAVVRNPLYQECADLVIDTNGKPPKMVVQEILQYIQKL